MKKMLVVTRNLPPLVGGMERLVLHLVEALRERGELLVVGPAGCGRHLPLDVASREAPFRPLTRFLPMAGAAALPMALSFRPNLVFAGSGLTAPIAWAAARLARCPCAVYLHGLDIEARNTVYRAAWLPFLRRCDLVLVNSRFSRILAEGIGIPSERIHILHPGVALPDMERAGQHRRDFRRRHGLGDAPVMLFVGRITARKGLAVFVRDILPLVLQERPEARLVVVGDEAREALLQNRGEMDLVRRALADHGLEHAVVFLGERPHDDPELSRAYFAAHALVFPVQRREHDNEGFGMVAVEAAAHGLPTIAFAAGGVPDAVADGVSGCLIPPGENLRFARAVLDCFREGGEASPYGDAPRSFAAQFQWAAFGERLHSIIETAQPNPHRT